jgi:hypothetical protein
MLIAQIITDHEPRRHRTLGTLWADLQTHFADLCLEEPYEIRVVLEDCSGTH